MSASERVTTGVPQLDEVLEGGIPRNSLVLVYGGPGTGKTTLGLQFLVEGTRRGEPGLLVTFEQMPEQLYRDFAPFGWDLPGLVRQKRLQILCTSPGTLWEDLLSPGGMVEEAFRQLRVQRLVIDPITLLACAGAVDAGWAPAAGAAPGSPGLAAEAAAEIAATGPAPAAEATPLAGRGAAAGLGAPSPAGAHPWASSRTRMYAVFNALRRLGATALLLAEAPMAGWAGDAGLSGRSGPDGGDPGVAGFLADGILELSFPYVDVGRSSRSQETGLDAQAAGGGAMASLAANRRRFVEVLKMRGSGFVPGRHLMRFDITGLALVRPLTRMQSGRRAALESPAAAIPTGLPLLDDALGGGFPRGATVLLDVNGKADYYDLVGLLIHRWYAAGANLYLQPSSLVGPIEIVENVRRQGSDLLEGAAQGRILLAEYFRRPLLPELEKCLIRGWEMSDREALSWVRQFFAEYMEPDAQRGRPWLIYRDLNTLAVARGSKYLVQDFAAATSWVRACRGGYLALVNMEEISPHLGSFLERTASVVVRTWRTQRYQFLQVVKALDGHVTDALVVEHQPDPPYIRLLD
ncbi:MAG: hypothetical protein IMW99_02170 [Firmicutes bacterium]|nr:hypothetical protein [Bacillota bacterium]